MTALNETDIDFDALYDELINAARTAARQTLAEEREEREIIEIQKALLDRLARS